MSRVKIFSTGRDPICDKTKLLLDKWRVPYEEIRMDRNGAGLSETVRVSNGARSVPQIVISGIGSAALWS